eukprot:TRINITY_DN6962_c0_g1_i1.p1 TRINITY_DN6962_c0_g1~~TRINITY_DN6962_c0_g1_i1.p1  ORF type:complete len:139 (-),score=40.09 TRINITY_DN6962_c0_g1_i1:66-482(-)
MTTVHSETLVWQLIKNQNAYLIKRNGNELATEEGNLKGINSFKYSGLARKKTVDLEETEDGLSLTTRKQNQLSQPATGYSEVVFTKHARKTANSLRAILKQYRPDLVGAALGRASKLRQVSKPRKTHFKKGRRVLDKQ